MASDIFRCSGLTTKGGRCKREAVRAVKTKAYWCPTHQGQPIRVVGRG